MDIRMLAAAVLSQRLKSLLQKFVTLKTFFGLRKSDAACPVVDNSTSNSCSCSVCHQHYYVDLKRSNSFRFRNTGIELF
jgi:hypothetical protein